MVCVLCDSINEDFRLLEETSFSFCVICKWPLKEGHVLIMPKRHVTQNNYSNLPAEEVKDLFSLVEKMQLLLGDLFDDNLILFKNSGSHSSEDHFHFHLLPSKGGLRELLNKYEGVPQRQDISKEDYIKMKEKINNSL